MTDNETGAPAEDRTPSEHENVLREVADAAWVGDWPDVEAVAKAAAWALSEVSRLTAELAAARKELADAAREINCAGPLAHRIRVLRQEFSDENARLTAALDRVRDDAERNARRVAVLDEYADGLIFTAPRSQTTSAFQPSVDWFIGDGSGHIVTHGETISECADKLIALLDGEETAARTQPEGSNG